MNILIPLIVAVLVYRINLIEKRKSDNFERFRTCFQKGKEWLDKDVPFHIMATYRDSANENQKRAALDYYQDWKVNESRRGDLIILIIISAVYLLIRSHFDIKTNEIPLDSFLVGFSIWKYLQEPRIGLFNNPIMNPENSTKVDKIYKKKQREIESDILRYESKYGVRKA